MTVIKINHRILSERFEFTFNMTVADQIFAEKCMKMKEIGLGRVVSLASKNSRLLHVTVFWPS